mgnify:CR=1 FL=1
MYGENKNKSGSKNFPNPLASAEEKESKKYGESYARAIEKQWGSVQDTGSIFKRRYDMFEKNRKYANGTQETSIYRKLLTSLNPNSGCLCKSLLKTFNSLCRYCRFLRETGILSFDYHII